MGRDPSLAGSKAMEVKAGIAVAASLVAGLAVGAWAGKPKPTPPAPPPAAATTTTPVSPEATPSPESASVDLSKPAESPQERLVAKFLPLLGDERLRRAITGAFWGNVERQRRLLDLILKSEDPEFVETACELLGGIKDDDFMKAVAEAFERETHSLRRRALSLSVAINFRHAEARPAIERVLFGTEQAIQTRMMQMAMNVQEIPDETRDRWVPRLREMVAGSLPDDLRAGAARTMRGDLSDEGLTILLQLALHDPSPAVQKGAMGALPFNWRSPVPREPDQKAALWTMVRDESRAPDVRRWAAERMLNSGIINPHQLPADELAFLKKLAGVKD